MIRTDALCYSPASVSDGMSGAEAVICCVFAGETSDWLECAWPLTSATSCRSATTSSCVLPATRAKHARLPPADRRDRARGGTVPCPTWLFR